jgi:predicted RNA binding protein YcfA (HicA-like mRNA interferase family)
VRYRGSHVVIQRRLEEGGTITVPVPLHREIRRGALLSSTRQSGLPRTAFEANR